MSSKSLFPEDRALNLVLVKEHNLRYHNTETMLVTIDPYCGRLIQIP